MESLSDIPKQRRPQSLIRSILTRVLSSRTLPVPNVFFADQPCFADFVILLFEVLNGEDTIFCLNIRMIQIQIRILQSTSYVALKSHLTDL